MTGRYQDCNCNHRFQDHMAGGCVLCPCKAFQRARAPMPSTQGAGQLKPLQKPKKGPLLDRDGQ